MQSYFIIGDIHGEITLLNMLLDEIGKYNPEKLIFIGDYIDRGPHPKSVIDRIMELGPGAVCLMGNHEMMMLNAIEHSGYGPNAVELWYYNGAEATLQSFGSNSFFSFKSDLDGKYLNFFHNLEMNHLLSFGENMKFLVTHAGVSPSIPISDQINIGNYRDHERYLYENHLVPSESFIWVREHFFGAHPDIFKGHIIIHGHTPVNKLKRSIPLSKNDHWECVEGDLCIRKEAKTGEVISIDIDSGSTISGRLSALGILAEGNVLQMKSITVSADNRIVRDLLEKNIS